MGLFGGMFGGGGSSPELSAPGPEEQAGLGQLVRRGEAGTGLSEAQVAALMQLIGPETATQLQALQQLQAFLSGTPYTSPTVEAGLRRQRGELDERLMRQFGPGGEVSTPGRAALAEFGTQSDVLREQARSLNIEPVLRTLGLLGPQGRQTAAIGFGDPSSGILRQTGVQERLGEFGGRSALASALAGQQGGQLDFLLKAGTSMGSGLGSLGPLLAKLLGGGGAAGAGAAGAGSALSAVAMAGGGAFSDRRLKTNIVRVGTHPLGIGLYEYDLFGHRERGVMADEALAVRPTAVHTGPDGFLRVDYAALGGR